MKTISLAGGRVTLTFAESPATTLEQVTVAVPYGTAATVAPVTAADWVGVVAGGGPVTVAVTLPGPVAGLGVGGGLPLWFSRARPHALRPDLSLGLAVADGVLFSGSGVVVLPRGDGLTGELTTDGDTATYTLTGAGRVALTVLDGADLRAVWTATIRQVGWPPEVPPLFDTPVIYTAPGADPAAIAQHGFPTGMIAPDGIGTAGGETAPDVLVAQTAAWGQRAPVALQLPPLQARWDESNGLGALPGQLLTAALLGYPFVVPGVIGGLEDGSRRGTGELLVRWTQAAAFTLSMVFGKAPWTFLAPTPGICRAYTWLHLALQPWLLDYAGRVTCANGTPPLRPLGLDYPTDSPALACADQWLLGDRVLVAPVLGPPRGRAVYLPAGRWFDPWTEGYIEGSKRLEVRVPLHICPFFILSDEDQEPWAAFPAAAAIVGQIKRMG
jgi:hypothetical protein